MVEAWFENRVVAWAGLVVGVVLLAFCGPALWSVLTDDDVVGKGWSNAWPVIGCIGGVTLLGLAWQGDGLSRKPRKREGPGAT